ncbi:MAG: SpoIIE family protein phosphatase [Anaerolineae bacterium]|nr:SpoIIE family protein phosphatase [Anaerolineae bacterium]
MSRNHKHRVSNSPAQRKRPTIGLVITDIQSAWSTPQWLGVHDGAKEHDANLICFAGSSLRSPFWFHAQSNVLYELINPTQLDGLILWTAGFDNYVSQEEVLEFCAKYHPLPIVCAENALPGFPSILMDQKQAIREVMVHMIEVHGYRRIGFIQDDSKGHLGFQARYRGYAETLAEYNLPLDPDLVFTNPGMGQELRIELDAMEAWLRSEKLQNVEAIVGHNDTKAMHAWRILRSQGKRIPGEIALAGFDDTTEGHVITPPLTSVRPPFYEMGRQAVATLLAHLNGDPVPEQTVLPSELMVRQSCGCQSSMVTQAVVNWDEPGQESVEVPIDDPQALAAALKPALAKLGTWAEAGVEPLAEALVAALSKNSPAIFLNALESLLQHMADVQQDLEQCQNVLSVLRKCVLPAIRTPQQIQAAENLWQQGRLIIAETTRRTLAYETLQAGRQVQRLNNVSQALITAFEIEGLMTILARELPALGIPSCYLSLYEDGRNPTAWARLRLGYNATAQEKTAVLKGKGKRFASPQLMPEGWWPRDRAYSFVVQALTFRKEQLGFVLFEAGTRDGEVYGTLSAQVSSAIKGALLVEQEERRSQQLQMAAEVGATISTILDRCELLKCVADLTKASFDLYHAHIYLFDRLGQTLVLAAGSGERGQHMVAEGEHIPLTDAALAARVARTRRGYILNDVPADTQKATQPLLPDTRAKLAVPLIAGDEMLGVLEIHATETNAFSEDDIRIQTTLASQIAATLQNVQYVERLALANEEIQTLNEQLTSDNVRMTAELDITHRLQQMLLPTAQELRRIQGADIAGYMQPAAEIGGDYYDVLEHNGQTKIGIGDVTGHGLESGVVMLMLQTAIRTLMTSEEKDPVRFLDVLNRTLYNNMQRMSVDKSLSLTLLDYQSGRIQISGQHEQLIVVRKGGRIELLDTLDLGFPLGLIIGIAELINEAYIELQPGDGIVLYSDGITEAENEKRELYGLGRLCAILSKHWNRPAEAIKEAVVEDVWRFIGKQKVYDDLTLLIVKQVRAQTQTLSMA